MEYCKALLIFAAAVTVTYAQRPFYAGSQPIGYPNVNQQQGDLSNRFGESSGYPLGANGDAGFINRVEQMPIDNRPFWYINAAQYEAQRRNPQTYPQRPNPFIDTFNRLRK